MLALDVPVQSHEVIEAAARMKHRSLIMRLTFIKHAEKERVYTSGILQSMVDLTLKLPGPTAGVEGSLTVTTA